MTLQITLENLVEAEPVPAEQLFRLWAEAAQQATDNVAEKTRLLDIRIVSEAESATLNRQYRNRDYATNVLSFPGDLPESVAAMLDEIPLGDLAICARVVNSEATSQNKTAEAHWAHMVIHGVLHLNGYDHITESDADIMESLEIGIMASLNYANPYNPV